MRHGETIMTYSLTPQEIERINARLPEHARVTAEEVAEVRAGLARSAEEERAIRDRGEWPALVTEARAVFVAAGWHLATAASLLAERHGITQRTAEIAVEEAVEG